MIVVGGSVDVAAASVDDVYDAARVSERMLFGREGNQPPCRNNIAKHFTQMTSP